MKVALIASVTDLGLEPSYYGKPTDYARFLGAELQYLYKGKLLIVMPQGAGLSEAGRLIASAAVVHAVVGSGVDGLARTAIDLVRELALGKPGAQSNATPSASGFPVWEWVVIAAGAAFGLLAVGLVVRRRRSSG
jgi:MYXO-CTERM domain-containing protein